MTTTLDPRFWIQAHILSTGGDALNLQEHASNWSAERTIMFVYLPRHWEESAGTLQREGSINAKVTLNPPPPPPGDVLGDNGEFTSIHQAKGALAGDVADLSARIRGSCCSGSISNHKRHARCQLGELDATIRRRRHRVDTPHNIFITTAHCKRYHPEGYQSYCSGCYSTQPPQLVERKQ